MQEMISLNGPGVRAMTAIHPISRVAYIAYLRTTGQPIPPSLARPEGPGKPATCVSQVEADEYCRWLGKQEGQPYRLPSMAELLQLYGTAATEGTSGDIWPADAAPSTVPQGLAHNTYYCEWTCETQEIPQYGRDSVRVLGSVFYPPWLREGSNMLHAQAHMLATEGYSFITFRVSRDA